MSSSTRRDASGEAAGGGRSEGAVGASDPRPGDCDARWAAEGEHADDAKATQSPSAASAEREEVAEIMQIEVPRAAAGRRLKRSRKRGDAPLKKEPNGDSRSERWRISTHALSKSTLDGGRMDDGH